LCSIKTLYTSQSYYDPICWIQIKSFFWTCLEAASVLRKVSTMLQKNPPPNSYHPEGGLMSMYIAYQMCSWSHINVISLSPRSFCEIVCFLICHSDFVLQFVTWVSSISLPFRSLFCRLLLPKRKLFINRLQAIHLLSLLHLRLWLTSFKKHLNLHSHFSLYIYIYIYICVYGLAYAFHVESERYIYIYLNI